MRRRMCRSPSSLCETEKYICRPYDILLDYGSERHHPSERARFAVKTDEYEPSVKASTERFLPQKK